MRKQMLAVLTASLFVVFAATAAAAAQQAKAAPQPAPATPAPATLVDINTATITQLEALPGVGVKLAERIVQYREKNGKFTKIEQLMNVQGIGEKNFLKLKPLLTVGAVKTPQEGR